MFRLKDSIHFDGAEYVIDKFLGQGGMGQVFSIVDEKTECAYALKSLQYFIPDDGHHRSIINEWEKAKKVTHKNVIRYLGFHDGLSNPSIPYLIMELAKDGTLDDFLKSQSDLLDENQCLTIFNQIIDGMEAVNSILVHRDIKPDNIFIDNGVYKIADFGLAKIASEKTRTKTFKGWGTEPYIAPEAYRSEQNTIQMDMYSIGHVFYQIAGLRHAFGERTDWEMAHLTAIAQPVNKINTKISPKVSHVINKMINKKPEERYISWSDIRNEFAGSVVIVGSHKNLIDRIVQAKNNRDIEAQAEKISKETKENKLNRAVKLIDYQFENEVISPVSEFINDFNQVAGLHSNIRISKATLRGDVAYKVSFENSLINIWLHNIGEEDVLTRLGQDVWGENKRFETKPELYGRRVLAWGGVQKLSQEGFNIVLLATDGDYGDWHILTNKHSALFSRQDSRPDHFAFSKDELLTEIHHINIMHIYESRVQSFEPKILIEFISNAFS